MAIITITGTPGSGKSTLAKLLAKRLGWQHYSMGDMQRKLAEERGMSIEELNAENVRTEGFTDEQVDAYQVQVARNEDNFVIDGRVSYHFIPQSIKLFLDANAQVRARRMLERKAKAQVVQSVEDALKRNAERIEVERVRWKKLYDTDPFELDHYDLVLDSTSMSPDSLVEQVLQQFKLG